MNAHLPFPRLQEPCGSLTGSETEPLAIDPATLRVAIEPAIEAMIALLDAIEGDADREADEDRCEYDDLRPGVGTLDPDDGDNEPSLGSLGSTWPSWQVPDQVHWSGGDSDDREDDGEEDEPSLGWTATITQVGMNWAGSLNDAEAEHDGREPEQHL